MEYITDAVGTAANETIGKHITEFINWFKELISWENLFKAVGAFFVILLMWIVYKLIVHSLKKISPKNLPEARVAAVIRGIKYFFYVVVVLYILSTFGVNLKAIWGAAGIAGVAIGFAAQTSMSNLISGLFVLTEGAIHIGDVIIIDGVTGIVDEVKLLSVRMHTFDNQMVRIPNSTIINNNLTNNSYHKARRITISVSIDYSTDMNKALEVLSKAPSLCPTVLTNPAPTVWFDGFNDSGINMTVAAWFKPSDFLKTKNDLFVSIKKVFDDNGIEIPFNQLDVKIKNNDND